MDNHRVGMAVRSIEGEDMGNVTAVAGGRFLIGSGLRESWVRDEVVQAITAAEVILRCRSRALYRFIATPPATPRAVR